MSYARYRAAAADVETLSGGSRLKWKLRQAQVELRASLPFLGDDVFVLIAAELDARMLGRLACTAPRFWRKTVPDPAQKAEYTGAPELWSVADEGARRRLAAHSEQVRGWVSRETSGGSWLHALCEAEKLQRPLRFTAHHAAVELGEEGTVATKDANGFRSAVCGDHEMRRGRHYATFTLRSLIGSALVGVVGEGFDPTGEPAWQSPQGWMLFTFNGVVSHNGRGSDWEGKPQPDEIKPGDVVGLLLDLGQRTLSVYLNGAWRGVMVAPGMKHTCGHTRGQAEAPLAGPLWWAVDVEFGASVRIERKPPPPPPPTSQAAD